MYESDESGMAIPHPCGGMYSAEASRIDYELVCSLLMQLKLPVYEPVCIPPATISYTCVLSEMSSFIEVISSMNVYCNGHSLHITSQ